MRNHEADSGKQVDHESPPKEVGSVLQDFGFAEWGLQIWGPNRLLSPQAEPHHQESSSAYPWNSASLWKKVWTNTEIIAFEGTPNC